MSKKKRPTKRATTTRRSSVDTSEFDEEMVITTFSSPDPPQQARWERALSKRGRPRRGSGAAVISVSVERSLLDRADLTARRLGITRSELIARGLRAALAATGTE